MARIRTIKPEFPQSESIGRLSREARLLFVMLWTIADDEGRARAASRMLASLLFPYDDDAAMLIDGWLKELDDKGRIRRYEVGGSKYLEVVNWLEHQKIDKPTKSKLPSFDEYSRNLAKPREPSTTDLGPVKDLVVAADVRACAREAGGISRETADPLKAFALILETIKADRDEPHWPGQHGRVAQWLANGWSLELDILPTCKRLADAARAKGKQVRRLEYYEQAIADAFASRTAPVPQGNPDHGRRDQSTGNVQETSKRIAAGLVALQRDDQWSGDAPSSSEVLAIGSG